MYSLEQVRSFVAIAEARSFRRAAEQLRMTQPPLSRQIQKLERELGVTLFDRGQRHVDLTAAGQAFLTSARRLLALADAAPDTARLVAEGHAGTVRIGFTAASGFDFLGRLITRLEEQAPAIDVVLTEMVSSEQFDELRSGRLDLALARPPADDEQFDSRTVHSEPMVVAVPVGHALDVAGPIATADLAGTTLLLYTRDRARYFADLTAAALWGVDFRPAHQLTQIHTMLALVAAGRGVALVPESARTLRSDGVTFRPLITGQSPCAELIAVWRREIHNPALRRVLGLLPTDAPASLSTDSTRS